jgi:nitroreductase
MTDTIKHIYQRRAVRKYKHMPVAKDIIDQLIAAGRMAPSAMNKQPWKFYVLTDKKLIRNLSKEIAEVAIKEIRHTSVKEIVKMTLSAFHLSKMIDFLKTDDHIFYGAPVVIFITSPVEDAWGPLDVGMCSQNIMLTAKAMGLDTCPVGLAKFVTQAKDFYLLNIPATEQVNLAIIVGYGDEEPKPMERIENNVVYI